MAQLRGTFSALLLYDVSEEIHLDIARELLGAAPPERRPEFRGPTPEYVRFEHPPIVCAGSAVRLPLGEAWSSVIKLYGYGVMSVVLELPFECTWDEVVHLASRWMGSPDVERCAIELARSEIGRIQRALVKPYKNWTMEDYYAVHVHSAAGSGGGELSAADLLTQFGGRVAQMVRGESATLSDSEISRVLEEWVSYYPTDLLVVAWMAAFIYDTPEGAAPILQLLEYANTQLLEFRHYDDLLTKVLADVYSSLDRRRGVLRRWRIGAEAERLNRIRLEVIELTERVDNSIKFLSDMFYARAYHLAARKIGVTDYRGLVDGKLKTAGDLYRSMVEEFHQTRTFVLELMVVAILIIELVFLFRGKP